MDPAKWEAAEAAGRVLAGEFERLRARSEADHAEGYALGFRRGAAGRLLLALSALAAGGLGGFLLGVLW